MSFRKKLSIAFSMVLSLTIIVSMTSWWGMRDALKSQQRLYGFQNHIERTFHEMSQQEQAFTTEETIGHSRQVFAHIKEMRQYIEQVQREARDFLHKEQLTIILTTLDQYESAFSSYVQQNLDMQTIRSRMSQESRNLQAHIDKLSDQTTLSHDLYHLVISAVLAQKEFTISSELTTRNRLIKLIGAIHEETASLRLQRRPEDQKLLIYRIDRDTTAFTQSFQQFIDEKEVTVLSHLRLRESFTSLREELANAISLESRLTNTHINFLQSLTVCTAILAIMLSIVATALLSEFISRPIGKLKESARKIVLGDLDTSVNIHSKDEIGELGLLFNEMTEKLRVNFSELKQYRDRLEELVQDRTHELEQEIVERKETEKALLASEKRFRTIFNSSTDGILVVEPRSREFILANQTICKMLGYSQKEILSLQVEDIHPPEQRQASLNKLKSVVDGSSGFSEDLVMRRKNGSTFQAEITGGSLEIGDNTYVLGCIRDISERHAIEAERLKSRKLESVGILAGGIAHDFNNILAAILGNVSLALALTDSHDRRFNLLTELEKASLRARDLTQQLLTFSKGGEPVKELTDVTKIIQESASFVLRGSKVRCDFDFAEPLWNAEIDAGQISQVIQNIVVNAKHAMPDGGVITIGCRNISESHHLSAILADQNCIEISITDNGPGIPEDLLEKIFDPYFTTKKEGSGLGLAITHSIISKHNGSITVSSPPGQGVTFRILLPAVDSPQPAVSSFGIPAISVQATGTIMIMDDEQPVREITSQLLSYLGYSVITVTNGQEAVDVYQQHLTSDTPVDLVIMDLTIPGGMGGKEAAEKILAIDANARLIVSSGYSHDPIMANFADFGFKGFLSKPYLLHDLQTQLQQVLRS